MEDEGDITYFERWSDWDEEEWCHVESRLAKALKDALEGTDEDQLSDMWMDFPSDDDMMLDFFRAAFKREKKSLWITFGLEYPFDLIVRTEELYRVEGVVERAVHVADRYASEKREGEPILDVVQLEHGIVGERENVNCWASLLRSHPEMAERCKCWEGFSGGSACNLLAVHPQFADKFSMKELSDPGSRFWSYEHCEIGFDDAWEALVQRQPTFKKFRP